MTARITFILITMVLLTACVTKPQVQMGPIPDPALVRLSEAAERIATAHEKNAKIQSSRYRPDYQARSYSYEKSNHQIPKVWKEEMSLVTDYHGDVAGFVKMLSAIAGLEPPRIIGVQPSRTQLISIPAARRPLLDFLATAGYQAGESVVVKPVVHLNQVLLHFKG